METVQTWIHYQATINDLKAQNAKLVAALKDCVAHIQELKEAWERGAISEHDGKGGTRSNRNWDNLVKARAVLKEVGEL